MTKNRLILLVTSILLFCALVFLILFFSPDFQLSFMDISIPIIYPFFLLFCTFLLTLLTVLLRSIHHGVLIALFATLVLIFRLNGLTHPFFLVILAGIFLMLELAFAKGKRK